MAAQTFLMPYRPAFDAAGISVPSAQLYFTLTGTNTTTPVYSESTLTTPLANPVVADGAGKWPAIYTNSTITYRVRVYSKTAVAGVDTPLEEYDPYYSGALGLITDPLVSLGYATGSGGAITQATSKATGVTLNKPAGQITMNAAALAAAAKVSFVVTNSRVIATDTIVTNVASGGTANAYRAAVTAVAAGSFTVTVENISAGPLSEAPLISFAVIKAVAT